VASNPPSTPSKGSGISRKVLGLPLWGWGVGATVLGIGVILYLRSRSASSTATSPQLPVPSGDVSPTVYPFYMGSTPGGTPAQTPTSSQTFGTIVGKGFAGNVVPNTVPLYSIPGADPSKPLNQQSASWAPDKTSFTVTGPPVLGQWGNATAGFYPVIYQGQQYYVSQSDTYPQNTFSGINGTATPGSMPAAIGG